MKKFTTILLVQLLFIVSYKCIAQTDTLKKQLEVHYHFLTDVIIQEYDFKGASLKATKKIVPANVKFKIVERVDNNGYVIKLNKIVINALRKKNLQKIKNNLDLAEDDGEKYFFISTRDYEKKVSHHTPKGWSLVAAGVVLPYRIRLGDGDDVYLNFNNSSFTLGLAGGVKRKISHFKEKYINLVFSAGITAASVDKSSFRDTTFTAKFEEPTDLAAFTPSIGLLYEHNEVQMGIFVGKDFLAREVGRDWKYQGKPWISVGIGLSILSTKIPSKKGGDRKKNRMKRILNEYN